MNLGTSRGTLERCAPHQMIGCAYCNGRPRFVDPQRPSRLNKVASPAAPRWDETDLVVLQDLGRYPSTEYKRWVLKGVAQRTGRKYQAVYMKWMVVTGQAHDRSWSRGNGVH